MRPPGRPERLCAAASRALGAASLAIVVAWLSPAHVAAQPRDPEVVATLCRGCHSERFESAARGAHGVLDGAEWRRHTGLAPGCLACHGDVSAHLAAGGGRGSVFAFRDESPSRQIEVCNDCHAAAHPQFDRSPHARAGLACTSCHSQHDSAPGAPSLLRFPGGARRDVDSLGAKSAVCLDCHGERRADFELNERHRLRAGVLECTSCHDPHAPAARARLGGFERRMCTGCHADKGGPFVFEHPASRVEGCTACHRPHGSPNRHLLENQRVAELCISCHAAVPQFHLGFGSAGGPRFGLDTQCTSCHAQIHGSNFDPHFLR